MKKGMIAFLIIMAIGVATYFIYQKSLEPKYAGTWHLIDEDESCFVEVEFSPGPKDYKGTVLKMVDHDVETVYLGGHKIEDGKIIVEIFNFDGMEPIKMDHEKDGDELVLTYDWKNDTTQCTYEKK